MSIQKPYLVSIFLGSLLLISTGHLVTATEKHYVLTVHQLNEGLSKTPSLSQKGFILIDVRTPDEHRTGSIPGTDLNIDFREIGSRHQEISVNFDDHIVVYCQSGHRSNIAAEMLANIGYKHIYNVAGSMNAWSEAGYPIQANRQ